MKNHKPRSVAPSRASPSVSRTPHRFPDNSEVLQRMPRRTLPHAGQMAAIFGDDIGNVEVLGGDEAEAFLAHRGARAAQVNGRVILPEDATPAEVAHELMHARQHDQGTGSGTSRAGDRAEVQAESLAQAVAAGDLEHAAEQAASPVTATGAVMRIEEGLSDCGSQQELDRLGRGVDENYNTQKSNRVAGVISVLRTTDESIPPPPDRVLLEAVTFIALSAVTASVGGVITAALASGLAKGIQAGVNKALQESIKALIKPTLNEQFDLNAPPGKVRQNFFESQSRIIREAYSELGLIVIHDVWPTFEASPDGCAEAQDLEMGIYEGNKVVEGFQKEAALESWLSFLAQRSQGVTQTGGTDLGANLKDASLKGVLGLEITSPGDGRSVRILGAEMDGVGVETAYDISQIPIGELDAPLTFHGVVWAETAEGLLEEGYVYSGRNEAGEVWDQSNTVGRYWLHGRALVHPLSITDENAIDKLVPDGVRTVIEHDIAPHSLAELGITIRTEGGILE